MMNRRKLGSPWCLSEFGKISSSKAGPLAKPCKDAVHIGRLVYACTYIRIGVTISLGNKLVAYVHIRT